MQIQISWLHQKLTDLDLYCLQRQAYPGSAGQGLRGVNTLSGEATLSELFLHSVEKRSTLKGKNLLPFLSKFFPNIVDPFSEEPWCVKANMLQKLSPL